jgi:hypothetical protein
LTITFEEFVTVNNKKYYINLFKPYPDVVNLGQFKQMLGGIADNTARKLLKDNHVQHFYIRETYLIPKVWVIKYVLSKHYVSYKEKLKYKV